MTLDIIGIHKNKTQMVQKIAYLVIGIILICAIFFRRKRPKESITEQKYTENAGDMITPYEISLMDNHWDDTASLCPDCGGDLAKREQSWKDEDIHAKCMNCPASFLIMDLGIKRLTDRYKRPSNKM